MTWNRPCVECGDSDGFGQKRIWMDRICVGDMIGGMPIPGDLEDNGDVDVQYLSVLTFHFSGTLDPSTVATTPHVGE